MMPPLKLWMLSDIMQNFDGWRFAEAVHALSQSRWIAMKRAAMEGKDSEVNPEFVLVLKMAINKCREQCKNIELEAAVDRIDGPINLFLTAYGTPTWEGVQKEIDVLWDAMVPELKRRRFAYITHPKAKIVVKMESRKDNPWKKVWRRFPSAKQEIKEGVYSYALELNTASVFHLMRAAEIGLRALARRMKIKLPKGKRLEWAQWQEMLREMNTVCDGIVIKMKAGPAKDELLEFYRGTLGQFYGFKDEFRNHVMHSRKSYGEIKAGSVLGHMLDFMNKLADRIDEKGRKVKT
jgi:hypothetical protein